jgi:hypothetical protein
MGKDKLLAGNRIGITGKLVCEPQDFTYNGPNTRSSGLGIFGGLQKRVHAKEDTGAKTLSAVVYDIGIANDKVLGADVLHDIHTHALKLKQFKEILNQSSVEEKVKMFHSKLQSRLEKLSRGTVTAHMVEDLVEHMIPYNIGLIAKFQLVVTRISRDPFPGGILVTSTGLHHKTVRSKQAFSELGTAGVQATLDAAVDIFNSAVLAPAVGGPSDQMFFVQSFETKQGGYRRLVPIDAIEGTPSNRSSDNSRESFDPEHKYGEKFDILTGKEGIGSNPIQNSLDSALGKIQG